MTSTLLSDVNSRFVVKKILIESTQGPMTLALLSDVNFILQQNDIRYCQNVKAAVSVHGVYVCVCVCVCERERECVCE